VRTLHALGALGGVVEASSSLREKFHQDYPGIKVWTTIQEALPHVPGFVIATPAASHVSLATVALAAGKGVLVEKPMALEVQGAEDLVQAAANSQRTLMVGHLLMYQPAIQKLKSLLEVGTIGRVFRIHQERLNLGRVRETENVLWSLGPHDVAVLLYLMGEAPIGVKAAGASFLQSGIHDDVHLELRFTFNRSAHVHASWYWPEQRRCLRVFGETGMIVYDEEHQTLTLHRKHLTGGEGAGRLATVDFGVFPLFEGHGEPLRLEDQHFLDCLASGGKPLSDGESGLAVIRVLERADRQLKQSILSPFKEVQ
jgi:predicted dehydrogenase